MQILYALILLVLVSSLWMAYDAHKRRISFDDAPYETKNGALAWFISGVLAWLPTYQRYMAKRSEAMRPKRRTREQLDKESIRKLDELGDLYFQDLITQKEYEAREKAILEQP